MQEQALLPTQLRIAWYILNRHRFKLAIFVLLTALAVAVGSMLATPIYSASSRILIKPGREDIYVSPTAESSVVMDRYNTQEQKLNSEVEILRSPLLVTELIQEMGLERLYDYSQRTVRGWLFRATELISSTYAARLSENPGRGPAGWLIKQDQRGEIPSLEDVQESLENSLTFSTVPKSNVIRISFDWPDPAIAAEALNRFVGLYLARHLKVHTDAATYDLLRDQAARYEQELRRSETELNALKARHSITSLADQKGMLLEKLSAVESEQQRTASEINQTRQIIATLDLQLRDLKRNVQVRETVNQQAASVADLKARLAELELQGLKQEIKLVKQMIAEEEKKAQVTTVSGESPLRQSVETDSFKARAQLGALESKARSQASQIAGYRAEMKRMDDIDQQVKELERQAAINEQNYRLYVTKFEEAKISESMDQQQISNVSVIEQAVPSIEPVRPNKKLNVLLGGLLALFAGTGLIFLLEFINPVFRTREDVNQFLGLPVLAVLPRIEESSKA